jgi:adenine/guanine/hypoxanthine permease
VALGAVFLSGVLFVLLTVSRVRALVVDAIPDTLKVATAAGIGLFIAFIGLRNAGLIVAHPATFVALGDVRAAPALLATAGLVVTAALMARGHKAAIIIGILAVSLMAMAAGIAPMPTALFSMPDPRSTVLALDIRGALALGVLDIVFVFLFVDLFDTVGSFMGLARQGGYIDETGRIPRINRALLADSTGSVAGALLGTSTVTTYIESAAGIGAGGRTGLTAVTVAALFVLAAFATPVAAAIPAFATAPALILVGVLMMRAVRDVDWPDITEALPAFVTMLGMSLTFSIANGLALGFITYPVVKLLAGRAAEVRPLVWVLAGLFALRFAYLGGG